MPEKKFTPLNIAVLTVSDSRQEAEDKSGSVLVQRIEEEGHHLYEKKMCIDCRYRIRAELSRWIADDAVDVVITTGGTGFTGRDVSPEAVQILFDKEITGFGELFRQISFADIGTSTMQSRAIAGVANATYIFTLPGSPGACRTAWDEILRPQLDSRTRPCNLVEIKDRLIE